MKTLIILAIAASWCAAADATTVAKPTHITVAGLPLPTYDDVHANWDNAGLATVGGIPTRSTVCATVTPSGKTPPTSGDDAALINAAIASCAAGDVVQLGAGTFNLDLSEYILLDKGITLRGSGSCTNANSPYCPTLIQYRNGTLATYVAGGQCGVNSSTLNSCAGYPLIYVSPNAIYDYGWSGCDHLDVCANGTPLAVDAAQGATTIQVASTTGFSVGQWALIDEASGAYWQANPATSCGGQVWAAPDWTASSGAPATGKVAYALSKGSSGCSPDDFSASQFPIVPSSPGCWYSYCDRPTSELHLISAIGAGPCPGTSCTITFDDPLSTAFRVGGGFSFTGSISGTTLTVATITGTPLEVGMPLSDTAGHVANGTYIKADDTGMGGTGTYTLNNSLTVASETMSAAAHDAMVYWPSHQAGAASSFLEYAGVENLSVARGPAGNILFMQCAYCWMKNVESYGWFAGGVDMEYTARSEVIGSYIHDCYDCESNGAEYPLALDDASTEDLVTDNIIRLAGKGMVGRTGAADVVSYNYEDDSFYMEHSSIGDYWVEFGLNASHYSGTHGWLFEGNWGVNCDNDFTHGNSVYQAYFRNDCVGYRTPFTDPSSGFAVNDLTGQGQASNGSTVPPAPLRAAGAEVGDYWDAFVGNTLGVSGVTTSANGWSESANAYVGHNKVMWLLGWNDESSSSTDPNLTSGAYIFQHGNFDYVDNAVQYASGYSTTLPISFYLFAAPSFFAGGGNCTYTFPWVTPTASPEVLANSCGGSGNPAKARWDAGTPFVQP